MAQQRGVGVEVLCGIRGRCEWVGGGRGVLRCSGGGGTCSGEGKGDRAWRLGLTVCLSLILTITKLKITQHGLLGTQIQSMAALVIVMPAHQA